MADSPQQPQYVYVPSNTADTMKAIAATKSYIGPALITLALYIFTFWIGGVIANILYLYSANNTQKISGTSPEGKGCLWMLLAVGVIIPVGLVVLAIVMGGFGAIIQGLSSR
jgi:hypothetical protein